MGYCTHQLEYCTEYCTVKSPNALETKENCTCCTCCTASHMTRNIILNTPPLINNLASYVKSYALSALSRLYDDNILKIKGFFLLHFSWICFDRVGQVQHPSDNSVFRGNLTDNAVQAHHCRAEAIVLAGFERSNVSGGHNHHALFGGFFVSVALCAQLVGRVWEAFGLAGFRLRRSFNPHSARLFLFERKEGGYINVNGAIIMANTPQHQKECATIDLLRCSDKLEDLRYRIGFISSGCAQSTDWIDAHAATELCCTINSIYEEMGEVIKRLDIARKAVAV